MSETTQAAGFVRVIDSFRTDYDRIVAEIRKVIVGHEAVIHEVLACLLGGGHVLLEGVPGLGKTLLVRTLGEAMELSFSRIQFTPDLMPADITGTNILSADDRGAKSFQFQAGPIFAHLVLADEINRATPKTQSAVLEAMQEHTVSVSRATYELPKPFMVLATQNPLEMEGTYPLPEAQLDRFMLKVLMTSPTGEDLVTIMDRSVGAIVPHADKVAGAEKVNSMRLTVRHLPAAEKVKRYIARIILDTHPSTPRAPEMTRKYVRFGASPRGAQAILQAARVRALREGRANVAFDDVRAVAPAALRHRLILSFEGQADNVDPDRVIGEVLRAVPETESA